MRTIDDSDVDIGRELDLRAEAPPDYGREHHAFDLLAADLAEDPRRMLQTLAEAALDLCDADTALVSVLADGVFRWEGAAGVFASARGSAMLRTESPSAACIERDTTLLMSLPDWVFPAIRMEPRFLEALLVPFHVRGTPRGVLWVVSHSPDRHFTRGHERVLKTLESLASAACQLRTASDMLGAVIRRQDTLLATLGHELRGPLGVITTAASVLQHRPSRDDVSARSVAAIARQCTHITRLADDLLDAGRIGTGKLQLQMTPLDIRGAILEAIEMCRPKLADHALSLQTELDGSPVRITGDRVRLIQMFANLLDNAAKYTPPGGQVSIRCTTDHDAAVVSVIDTGQGIPVDQLGRIFEPFAQVRDSSGGGVGLGLSLVRDLAQLHGGSVDVASDGSGLGSRFTIRLPLQLLAIGAREPGDAAVQY